MTAKQNELQDLIINQELELKKSKENIIHWKVKKIKIIIIKNTVIYLIQLVKQLFVKFRVRRNKHKVKTLILIQLYTIR